MASIAPIVPTTTTQNDRIERNTTSRHRHKQHNEDEITKSLAELHSRLRKQRELQRLGIDPENFLDWKVTPFKAVLWTCAIMLSMYAMTGLFCCLSYMFVLAINHFASPDDDDLPVLKSRQSLTKAALLLLGMTGFYLSLVEFALFHIMRRRSIW